MVAHSLDGDGALVVASTAAAPLGYTVAVNEGFAPEVVVVGCVVRCVWGVVVSEGVVSAVWLVSLLACRLVGLSARWLVGLSARWLVGSLACWLS